MKLTGRGLSTVAVKLLPLCLWCHDSNLKAVVSAPSTKTCTVRSKTDLKVMLFSLGVLNVNVHSLKTQAVLEEPWSV